MHLIEANIRRAAASWINNADNDAEFVQKS